MRQRDPSALIHLTRRAPVRSLGECRKRSAEHAAEGFTVREGPMVYLKCDSVPLIPSAQTPVFKPS